MDITFLNVMDKERPLRVGVNQKEPEKTYETFKDNKKNDTFYGVVLIYLK